MNYKRIFSTPAVAALVLLSGGQTAAQSVLYPQHFDLSEVRLLDGPFRDALELNCRVLMRYDADRLMTPFVRQSGLAATHDAGSRYYKWEERHPSFPNWGSGGFNLDGHVGGHYLTALAMGYAATGSEGMRQRLDSCIAILDDCQRQFDNDTTGLCGFIGGQPVNEIWQGIYAGNLEPYRRRRGWVPLYCQHKVMAGLRDAYVYAGNRTAMRLFRKMAGWAAALVSRLSQDGLDLMLRTEHGGMGEVMADAYKLFGDSEYLDAARRYSHREMLDGMQTLDVRFLDGRHANTQVPKYIGFERISQVDPAAAGFATAARNFWLDVAGNRTTCIGGNSVREKFLTDRQAGRYISSYDGPETCNTNNMLKLSEMLFDATHDARYADFYEAAVYNHILSTQDPATGGYVYFTTLRPGGYRIYSRVNQAMWCCVGTGMENHCKYGHFIYTHSADTLFVNLFMASELRNRRFGVRLDTRFPYEPSARITVTRPGRYVIAVRKPAWIGGEPASYTFYDNGGREWRAGQTVSVSLPMTLRYEECPGLPDYIAFKYGPVLLGAQITAADSADAAATGLEYETLPNEFAGEGRMDHAPGSRATGKSLLDVPMLIGDRGQVLGRITATDPSRLLFDIDVSRGGVRTYRWSRLRLRPFFSIHHARYMCYWYQAAPETFARNSMAREEAAAEELFARTADFVVPGEQQSEAGHEYDYPVESRTALVSGESCRTVPAGGYVQYTLADSAPAAGRRLMLRLCLADSARRMRVLANGTEVAAVTVPAAHKAASRAGFYTEELALPAAVEGQRRLVVRFEASGGTPLPHLFDVRIVRPVTGK